MGETYRFKLFYIISIGFFPGTTAIGDPSKYLDAINQNIVREGRKVFSFWSSGDDIIKYKCIVFNKNTCAIQR
jgi:hypothetical protein